MCELRSILRFILTSKYELLLKIDFNCRMQINCHQRMDLWARNLCVQDPCRSGHMSKHTYRLGQIVIGLPWVDFYINFT